MDTPDRGERQGTSTNADEASGGYYSVEEAAKVLELTRGRIRQMLRTGILEGERGGSPQEPWRIPARAVHALRDERPPRMEQGGVGGVDSPQGAPSPLQAHFENSRELSEKIEDLQREIGRLEMRLEYTKTALQEGLDREKRSTGREREERMRAQQEALKLREELAAERGRWSWKVGVLIVSIITVVAASLAVLNEILR